MAKAKAAKKQEHQRPDWELKHDIRDNPNFSRDHDEGKYGNARKIGVVVNIRESSIETMFARGQLDEAQREAANRFRRLFEALGGTGARAIDWRREAVDGGRFPDPIGAHAIDAGKKLALAYEVVEREYGIYGWRLIGYVCGEGWSVTQLTETRRQRDTMMDCLRMSLDCLAEHWRLRARRPQRPTVSAPE